MQFLIGDRSAVGVQKEELRNTDSIQRVARFGSTNLGVVFS